jgi:hypothetical protein
MTDFLFTIYIFGAGRMVKIFGPSEEVVKESRVPPIKLLVNKPELGYWVQFWLSLSSEDRNFGEKCDFCGMQYLYSIMYWDSPSSSRLLVAMLPLCRQSDGRKWSSC